MIPKSPKTLFRAPENCISNPPKHFVLASCLNPNSEEDKNKRAASRSNREKQAAEPAVIGEETSN